MGYVGSEEFIRLQFEEYILSLISSFKYHVYLQAHQSNPRALLPHIEYDPVLDFGTDFVDYWTRTENHRMWNTHTDSHLFDVVEPKHPCAGGLTIDDVQRRIAQQVQDMHLDERFAQGREVLGRNIAAGRDKASTMFNKFYADLETYREAQRLKAKEQQEQQSRSGPGSPTTSGAAQNGTHAGAEGGKGQQTAGAKAGAYVGSWVSWAGEKRKGWGAGWGKKSDKSGTSSPGPLSPTPEKEGRFSGGSFWGRSSSSRDDHKSNGSQDEKRPMTGASFSESIISAAGTTDEASGSPKRGRRPLSAESVELQVRDVTPAQELPVLMSPVNTPMEARFGEERLATGELSPIKVDGQMSALTSPVKAEAEPIKAEVSPVKAEEPVKAEVSPAQEEVASPIKTEESAKEKVASPVEEEVGSPVKAETSPVKTEEASTVPSDKAADDEEVRVPETKEAPAATQDVLSPAAVTSPTSLKDDGKAA